MTDEEVPYTVYKWKERTEFDILFRAKANQVAIVAHRGFSVPETQMEQLTWSDYAQFERKKKRYLRRLQRQGPDLRASLSETYEKLDDEGNVLERLYVVFVTETGGGQSIKKDTVSKVIAQALKEQTKNIMLISALDVHQDTLRYTKEGGLNFEIYAEKNMCMDRFNHVLNPKVIPLNKEEKQAFFQETGLAPSKIARYESWNRERAETAEPLLQHYQYPPGTLIKIVRENNYTTQVATESLYWRTVI